MGALAERKAPVGAALPRNGKSYALAKTQRMVYQKCLDSASEGRTGATCKKLPVIGAWQILVIYTNFIYK